MYTNYSLALLIIIVCFLDEFTKAPCWTKAEKKHYEWTEEATATQKNELQVHRRKKERREKIKKRNEERRKTARNRKNVKLTYVCFSFQKVKKTVFIFTGTYRYRPTLHNWREYRSASLRWKLSFFNYIVMWCSCVRLFRADKHPFLLL